MANWRLSDEGYQLFREHLKTNGWDSLSNNELSRLLKVDRSIIPNLLNGSHQGHKSKLENVMINLGLKSDEVESDSFAERYFQEVKSTSKSQPERGVKSSIGEPLVKVDNLGEFGNPFQPLKGRIENPKQFFNREKELRDIFEFLNGGSGVELLGDRQMGKSSLLQQIKHCAVSALTGKWEVIYLNLQKVHSEGEFYESFCEELDIANCTGIDLNRAMKSRRVLLLLDETENLQGNGFTREICDRLRAFSEDGSLRLVVAACTPLDHLFPDSDEKGMTSPFKGICLRVELKPWQEETVQKFVATRLENTGICFSEEEMEKLWRESQGHPQKLMKACFDLYRQYCEKL